MQKSRYVADVHHLRLMSLLNELVREKGNKGAARVLGIDRRTVAASVRSARSSDRTRATERIMELEIAMIDEHGLTLSPANSPMHPSEKSVHLGLAGEDPGRPAKGARKTGVSGARAAGADPWAVANLMQC